MDRPSTSSSTDDTDINLCRICNSDKENERLVNVGLKGKGTLKKVSRERSDNLFTTITTSNIVYVHASCRSDYINKINVEAYKRKAQDEHVQNISPAKRKLRSISSSTSETLNTSNTFDWEENCMICGNEANVEKQKKIPVNRRKKICKVESPDIVSNILKKLSLLNDDYYREIFKRISGSTHFIALKAKYHKECYQNLFKAHEEKSKEPKIKHSNKIDQAMEDIYNFLQSSDECQFSMTEIKEAVKNCDLIPHENTIKNRLKSRFGDQIIISSRMGGTTYVCFSKNLYDILTDSWYSRRAKTIDEEENRLIDAASELIRQKIRKTVYRMDEYPASDKVFTDVKNNIPPHLFRFLNSVIYKDKEQTESNENWYAKRIIAISHAIISAARPKSFLSPLQLAAGATFYRKFGSKKMIDLCYQLGFSCSYREVKLYEISAACQAERILINPFLQIVSDNSDFNICTIDGRKTFHNLGSIEIITPANSLQERMPIKRLTCSEIPNETELIEKNKINILLYTKSAGSGLKNILVKSMEKDPSFKTTFIDQLNNLWMFFKYVRENIFLGWNGFMSMLTNTCDYELSVINFLPFINDSPSNYNTLYTALKFASELALKECMKTCIITFDQPLYIKARDIVEASIFDQVHMVVRLGGFHLLMSYMGCIGQIMAGSGINDIFSIIYAEGSVEKILSGHSYARAVRAHIILQQALSHLLFDEMKRENIEFQSLLENSDSMSYEMNFEEISSNPDFEKLNSLCECKLNEIEKRGKTCKLWILYFKMVSLLKTFLAAERMGDWESHLNSIEIMIPFFHSAGHFNYAKSARLYLQDMKSLKETMDPVEYEKFTKNGFFTARRSNIYYAGIFSDQTIEQTLMRAMSVEGGPFKRGATESVVFKWIKGILYTKDIIEGLEKFCDIEFHKSHQHVDSRDARIEKDKKDVLALLKFLVDHNPFENIDNLRNIVTGLVGTEEINCYDAFNIGIKTMKTLDGVNFNDIKQSKKNTVISLLGVNSKLKIGDKTITIDPLLLFQRICVMKKSDEELESYLKYELAPYPLSLFDEVGMRKSTKSVLYSLFQSVKINLSKETSQYIIDGGMLLYRVKWSTDCTYEKVFQEYISYLKRNFGNNIIVVFDSYDGESTKSAERSRRSQKGSFKEYQFTKEMPVTISQEKFLSNYKNKSRFVSYLIEELLKHSIKCYQEQGEADELIVEIAINNDSSLQKVIVAEDVDILVILTARANEDEIYFLKLGKSNVPSKVYSSKSFEIHHPDSAEFIIFSHCFTGCDTTSAFYNKGKMKFFNLIKKRSDLRDRAKIFNNSNAKLEDILEAGRYCTILLYGIAKDIQLKKLSNVQNLPAFLEQMRYESFIKATTKNAAVKLSSLIPSVDALNEHIKRVYLQTQIWLGNKNIRPTDWGWINCEGSLQPTKILNKPAPEELLVMIFCNCKKGCSTTCSCRKVGLFCNAACGTCSGDNCKNCPPITDQEEDVEDSSDEL